MSHDRTTLATRFDLGDWRVDTTSGTLERDGDSVRLEPRVMAVLLDLAENAGAVRSKDELIESVWADTHVGEAALSRCVSELRRVLGDDARDPKYIETLTKRGYRLVAPVRPIVPEAAPSAAGPGAERRQPQWRTLLAAAIMAVLFAAWWGSRPEPGDGPIETIAVLPLRALSDEASARFFAEGLTEQLIASLSTIDSIRVVSGRSARLARDADASSGSIAAALGVDAVVDGSVQLSADRTLVSLELVAGTTERLVWGGSYQERGDDWLEMEQEIAAQAAREIALALSTRSGRPATRPTADPEAVRELDRGRLLAARGGPVDAIRAIDHFRRALEIDDAYASAWAALAESLASQAWNNWSDPMTTYTEAREAAHTALDLDPTLPEAHAILAAVAAERNQDWPEAERRFRTAIELDPPSAYALERYGRYLRRVGRATDAVARSQAALMLEPDSIPIAVSHGWNLLLADRLDEARGVLEAAIDLDSSFALAYSGLCAIANLQHRYDAARASCARAAAMPGHERALGPRAYAEAGAGDTETARATLSQLLELDPAAAALATATAHVGLGDEEAAIATLEAAHQRRSLWLPALLESPYLRPLHDDRRVRAIVNGLLLPMPEDDG